MEKDIEVGDTISVLSVKHDGYYIKAVVKDITEEGHFVVGYMYGSLTVSPDSARLFEKGKK